MINTVLSQITGLFQKDFLFASFLPALMLFAWLIAVVLVVFGIDYVFGTYEALTTVQQVGLATLATLALIVTAYLLNALRGPFIRIWSGESQAFNGLFLAPIKLARLHQTARFLRLRASTSSDSIWLDLAEDFRAKVNVHWSKARPAPRPIIALWIMYRARSLKREMHEAAIRRRLDKLAGWYAKWSGESLKESYEHVKRELTDWAVLDSFALQRNAAQLDRSFGAVATIRATSLGNVIEAYNNYAYTRYRMDTELFWPRLMQVIPEEFLALVREPKILLDFAITMATISVVVAVSSIMLGPWLWFDVRIWGGVAAVQLLAAVFFYFLSVDAGVQYGDMLRSCFDLFRLDLLKQLSYERPGTLKDEMAQWERVSQLIVYGQETDLKIAPADAQ